MSSYATLAEMISRYGETEMLRLSVPEGQALDMVVREPVEQALRDSSDIIDTYLRRRYRTPLDAPAAAIVRACCVLARYDLSTGGGKEPSEQVRLARKEVMDWLVRISEGQVFLDGILPTSDESGAMMRERETIYSGPGDYP